MLGSYEQTAYRLLAGQFKSQSKYLKKLNFKAGSMIVEDGLFTSPQKVDMYTAVPLSYIESGSVSIIEYGKAVKHFNKGDCIGLFETACFLEKGFNKRIGRWSVKAASDVSLAVSSESFLDKVPNKVKVSLITAAKHNPIPKPLTKLPLLDWFAKIYDIKPQKDTAIVYHSHVFDSSVDLLKHLAYIAGSDNTFVLEKPYSTLPHAFGEIAAGGIRTYQLKVDSNMSYEYSVKRNVDYVWREIIEHVRRKNIKKIIVVSDGADALLSPIVKELKNIKIIGIEQTERGLRRFLSAKLPFPVITVADTKAKKNLESPFIAEASLAKIASLGYFDKRFKYGVVGAGSIGQEIVKGLKKRGITPLIYDPIEGNIPQRYNANTLERLVQKSDIIIGNTGTDSLRGMHIERIKGKKIFISTSSSNVEFAYLFDLARTYANKFENIILSISNYFKAVILNGGYPINFDRTVEWEDRNNIQLTRALIYAGVYEALRSKKLAKKVKKLNRGFENAITEKWLELKS